MLIREYSSLKEAYQDLDGLLAMNENSVQNVIFKLPIKNGSYIYQTLLWNKQALEYYSYYNLGLDVSELGKKIHMNPLRGGPQGDYRKGMKSKIEKVILSLKRNPKSKRAVLTIPFTDKCSLCVKSEDDAEWKCLREIYFSIEDGKLSATGVMRSQALNILPKNIHFIGTMIERIAKELNVSSGTYTHFMHYLVTDRN